MGNGEIKETNEFKRQNLDKKCYKIKKASAEIKRINEIFDPSNNFLIFEDIDKARKSVCKIISDEGFGTGFFFDFNMFKYLITNYHVVNEKMKNIKIEIWNKHCTNFNLNGRNIIYLPKPKDITVINLRNNEIDNIEYLSYDLNYLKGYNYYKNKEVFSLGYPKGDKLASGSGLIKEIIYEYDFYHNIPTFLGSSGSPIILLNTLLVIGIHKEADIEENLNVGVFIGEAIEEINKRNNIKRTGTDLKNHNINLVINSERNFPINIKKKYNININDINIDNNIIKKDNDLNSGRKYNKKRTSFMDLNIKYNEIKHNLIKNEINCVYSVKKNREIYLLHDFKDNINNFKDEIEKIL